MPKVALQTRREHVRASIEAFAGRPIEIGDRVYSAFETQSRRSTRPPHNIHVWAKLSEVFPALNTVYSALAIDLSRLLVRWPPKPIPAFPTLSVESQWAVTIRETLTVWDQRVPAQTPSHELTPPFQRAIATGTLTLSDVTASLLYSGQISTRHRGRVTNPIMRSLAEAAGAEDSVSWNDQVAAMATRASAALDLVQILDESSSEQQFVLYHDGTRYRIRPFGMFGGYRLSESTRLPGAREPWIIRGNLVEPLQRFSDLAISELEELINRSALEKDFQTFFQSHPEFLLALGPYSRLHAQLILHEDSGQRLIPDFFMERIDSDFCDVLDLKRPTVNLVRYQRHRDRFRDAVMEAVAQLEHYRDWFDDRMNRRQFLAQYGINAFRPRVVIVIGRKASYTRDVDRIQLESRLPSWVDLKTYDDIVARAQQWRALVFGSPYV
jgi:Shedu protein SduA, C-terminal